MEELHSKYNDLLKINHLYLLHPLLDVCRDRATYDPHLSTTVNYTVASLGDAPASLTFGPAFFSLADQLEGDVTIGLNRQLGNMTNTGAAAVEAVRAVRNLLAIELGNEPECSVYTRHRRSDR